MSAFKFYHPVQVRYGDLDPQWHVNNAHTVTFIEHARMAYLEATGLFDGKSFFDLGLIVADVHVSYHAPIELTTPVRIGVRVARIGTKSLTFEYEVQDSSTQAVLALAETIMVSYDYNAHRSIPVPQSWKDAMSAMEGVKFE